MVSHISDAILELEALPGLQSTLREISRAVQWAKAHESGPHGFLVCGQTGAGKSLIWRRLLKELGISEEATHRINCSTLDDIQHARSELFGHKKGSFTGAERERLGALGNKDYKVLILEEFETLPLQVQAHLLTYLDNGRFVPLGADEEKSSSTHLVCVTNIAPGEDNSGYRDDLLYRLTPITIPAFKQRRGDAVRLFNFFLNTYGYEQPLRVVDALYLATYDWPGGIREIRQFAFDVAEIHKTGAQNSIPIPFVFTYFKLYRLRPSWLGIFLSYYESQRISFPLRKLNAFSSLFPKDSIYEPCDLNRINWIFMNELFKLKADWSQMPRPMDKQEIERWMVPRVNVSAEFNKLVDAAMKEHPHSSYLPAIGAGRLVRLQSLDVLAMFSSAGPYSKAIEEVIKTQVRVISAASDILRGLFPEVSNPDEGQESKEVVEKKVVEPQIPFNFDQPLKAFLNDAERCYWHHLLVEQGLKKKDAANRAGYKSPSSVTARLKKVDYQFDS